MKTTFFSLFIFTILCIACTSTTNIDQDKQEIRAVMAKQQAAWSEGDVYEFMEGYWKSDSLKFYGSRGLTNGWEQTLSNYKKSYKTKVEMGSLQFTLDDISPIENQSYWVMGRWELTRENDAPNGTFLIIFKKIDGQWRIVADMSC
ncbi:MAG: nuclear transport factor 2 family protein [Gilvibacter sp.]